MAGVPNGDANTFDSQLNDMNAMLAQNWWALALRGVAAVLFGLVALLVPGAVMLSLAWLFAAYMMVDGVCGLIASMRAARSHERWGLLLSEAVLNIAMGVIALFFPIAAVLGFVIVMAAWALLSGGLMLAAALRLHVSHGRWWLALGGIVSIIWGLILVVAPMVGAVVFTWWLGVYAVVFGILLLVVAFQLRGQHTSDISSPQASGGLGRRA